MLKDNNYIEYLPIAYMRGINIDNAVIIIDEAQNISIQNLKTIMTRLGENSRMIFLGDMKQKDIKNKKDSALEFLFDEFNDIKKIGVVSLTVDDIVRNPLIKEIEKVFDKVEEKSIRGSQPNHQPTPEISKTPFKYKWLRFKSRFNKLFR
jgi:phosphate starvation-inducible PhoH-like protein